jgi:hypothetical protein
MTPRLTISKIEDHEGNGRCSACDREGLRWICTLSDSTTVGTECAKKLVGYKPAPKQYQWVADFAPGAEHNDHGVVYVMWQHKSGNATRETRNGHLSTVGGVGADWDRLGWAY